jgi:hypothetical protein
MVYLFVGLFLLLTAYALFLVFSSAPRLVVSSKGIWVNSPLMFGRAVMRWAEMKSIRDTDFQPVPFAHQTYLVIELRDRQTLRTRQNGVQAALYLLSGYSFLWPGAVAVNDTVLSMSSVELLGRIHARYGPELARHGVFVPGGHI